MMSMIVVGGINFEVKGVSTVGLENLEEGRREEILEEKNGMTGTFN